MVLAQTSIKNYSCGLSIFNYLLQNIDLHALTGWIPERISIDTSDPTFAKDKIFNMLVSKHNKGDVLITVATGEISQAEADRSGLVPTHAYALLDIKEVLVSLIFNQILSISNNISYKKTPSVLVC